MTFARYGLMLCSLFRFRRRPIVAACGLVVWLTGVGSIVSGTVAEARAATTIVVNWGAKHALAEKAANAEEQVDWRDPEAAAPTACTHAFAAVELQHYLRKMTGCGYDFPIAGDQPGLPSSDLILLGNPATNAQTRAMAARLGIDTQSWAALGPEGYRIKSATVDGHRVLVIAGGGRVGTLYGVYDLLHRLGCRWFAPGPLHEEVPPLETLPELDIVERPAFLTRGFLAWEDRGNPEFLLWMARNRLNQWCVEQNEHGLMHKLGIHMVCGLHDAEELFLNPNAPYPYRRPGSGNDGKPRDPYRLSEVAASVPAKNAAPSYFEAHPEWFALVKGKRIPGIKGMFGTNFCTSNPDAVTEFMRNYVRALVDGAYRDADIVRFWTLDVGRWCECDACRDLGTPSDRNLLLVHRFAEEIAAARRQGRIHRPLWITFLAYADVVEPPTRPLPSGFDYTCTAATFYPIRRCYVHRFDDPCCEPNQKYLKQLTGWARDPDRHYRGSLMVGEYYNVSCDKCLPLCFMHTMANDIPCYFRMGARHFDYMHVTCERWGNKALTNYQMARQIWDPRTDCEALWQDYFTRRYGAAGKTMREFYESLETMFANVTELKYGLATRLRQGASELFPQPRQGAAEMFPSDPLRYQRDPAMPAGSPTLLEMVESSRRCRELLTRVRSTELPSRIRDRIAEDECCFTYGERTLAYYHACVQAFLEGRAGKKDQARSHLAEAERLAELLRADTTSTSVSSSHSNAPNAFEATLATGALAHLRTLLKN